MIDCWPRFMLEKSRGCATVVAIASILRFQRVQWRHLHNLEPAAVQSLSWNSKRARGNAHWSSLCWLEPTGNLQALRSITVQTHTPFRMNPFLWSRHTMFEHLPRLQFNLSAHADTQHQDAASRRVLCAVGLQSWAPLQWSRRMTSRSFFCPR